jgi:hypothetical protein
MTTNRGPFQFSAPEYKSMPETSPKRKPNPEPLTSGDSSFESATGSPAPEPTEQEENSRTIRLGESSYPPIDELIEGGPQVKTKQT